MKWMKERDLLIAQTMAFVQSVTGKTPEAEKTVTTSVALLSVETSETIRRPQRSPSRHQGSAGGDAVRCAGAKTRCPGAKRSIERRNTTGDIEAGSSFAT